MLRIWLALSMNFTNQQHFEKFVHKGLSLAIYLNGNIPLKFGNYIARSEFKQIQGFCSEIPNGCPIIKSMSDMIALFTKQFHSSQGK